MWWLLGAGAVLIVLLGMAGRARSQFESSVRQRIEAIEGSEPVRLPAFDDLPPLLRRYLEKSGLQPGETYRAVQLRQEGEIKLGQKRDWQGFEARQWFAVDRPAFVWAPSLSLPVGSVKGVDRLDHNGGRLQMRLFGILPVADDGGPEILKAQLLRYMAELPWVPAALAVNEALDFEQVDDRTVRVTGRIGEVSASIDLFFDQEGDIVGVETDERPWERENGEYVPQTWGGTFDEYREFDGLRVPTAVEVYWELPEGRYTYFRGEVTNFGAR